MQKSAIKVDKLDKHFAEIHRITSYNVCYTKLLRTVSLDLSDTYYNMKSKVPMHIVEAAMKAMEAVGVTPYCAPIRGGTDGSRLSYMGLPCPNLCTGGHNFHGRYEFISTEAMEKVVQILEALVPSFVK